MAVHLAPCLLAQPLLRCPYSSTMFSFSSGVKIYNGTFYDIAGDMNLVESTQLAVQGSEAPPALDIESNGRELLGAERTMRHGGGVRMSPYDVSRRTQLTSSSHHSSEDGAWPVSTPTGSLSEPIPHPLPPLLAATDDFAYGSRDLSANVPYPHYHSATKAIEYQPTNSQPMLDTAGSRINEAPPVHNGGLKGPSNAETTRGHGGDVPPCSSSLQEQQWIPTSSGSLSRLFNPLSQGTHEFQQSMFIGPRDYPSGPQDLSAMVAHRDSGLGHTTNPQSDSLSMPRTNSTSYSEDAYINRHGAYLGSPRMALECLSESFEQLPSHEPPVDLSGTLTNPAFPWIHPQPTNIYGGTFIGGNVNHTQRNGETGELEDTFLYILAVETSASALQILHRASAGDAFHDSEERYPQPRCHPETRTELLDTLCNWACGTEPRRKYTVISELDYDSDWTADDHPSSRILWLHGPAGSGKSAVAQSFCQKLQGEGQLGAGFFFKRGHPSRGNAKKLFPTIAYQLARLLPEFNHSIAQTVYNDPAIVDRDLSLQLQKLIIEPYQQSASGRPVVIVIDGLDECDVPNIQQEILRLIGHSNSDGGLLLHFFIASRREPHISEVFSSQGLAESHCPLNIDQSFEDVRKYLQDEFSRIHQQHHETMAKVPAPWPSLEVIDHLTKKSSGYFIYASTVIKFVDNKDCDPVECLDIVMGIAVSESSELETPFRALDELYIQILSQTRPAVRARLPAILTIVLADFNLLISDIEQLLQLKTGHVWLTLRGLHSVVCIEHEDAVTVHHASFRDFLEDPKRSGIFWVGSEQHRLNLARHLLRVFTWNYDDQSMNRHDEVTWMLVYDDSGRDDVQRVFQYIASVPASPDLVSLLQKFNPYFLFQCGAAIEANANAIVDWLKKSHRNALDLIRLWEDYKFMGLCNKVWIFRVWSDGDCVEIQRTSPEFQNPSQILRQAPPQLVKILRAYRVLQCRDSTTGYGGSDGLVEVHLLLDLSWDELRKVICSVHTIMGNNWDGLRQLLVSAADPTLCLSFDFDSILWDLGGSSLWQIQGYGLFIRSCPPHPGILPDLLEIVSEWENSRDELDAPDFHHIIQWLKASFLPT
ncbi:hypothetical protein C8R44DRAFT_725536 [Mycena epipterygia]|nr:hypothetical protein C8R44DRAFT_725536 [Mycena epipterygia]